MNVVSGGTTYTDNFNRANEDPLSGGGNWTHPGVSYVNLKVSSNQVTSSTSGQGIAHWATSNHSFAANQYAQVKIVTNDAVYAGPIVRFNTSNAYFYRVEVSYGDVSIKRARSDGNGTSWTVASGQSITGKVLKLSASGTTTTTLKVYIDGVQVGSDVTDNSAYVLTSGQPGMCTSESGVLDDFEAAEL